MWWRNYFCKFLQIKKSENACTSETVWFTSRTGKSSLCAKCSSLYYSKQTKSRALQRCDLGISLSGNVHCMIYSAVLVSGFEIVQLTSTGWEVMLNLFKLAKPGVHAQIFYCEMCFYLTYLMLHCLSCVSNLYGHHFVHVCRNRLLYQICWKLKQKKFYKKRKKVQKLK